MLRQIIKKGRHSEFLWRYGFNAGATLGFRFGGEKKLKPVQQRIVGDLRRDGIAITSVEELLGGGNKFDALTSAVDSLLTKRSGELAELRSAAGDETSVGRKNFNIELLGSIVEFDSESIFARFALQEPLLAIANSYFRMRARLRYFNVWYTFATSSAPRESQLWHFDREDNYILKLFLYLKDVNGDGGPFTYAPATHRFGRLWKAQPEYSLEGSVRRSSDEQMSRVVPPQDWIKAVGSKGMIVFADTRGFHKGGEARGSDRLMYTAMYTSPASDARRLIKYSEKSRAGLTAAEARALDLK